MAGPYDLQGPLLPPKDAGAGSVGAHGSDCARFTIVRAEARFAAALRATLAEPGCYIGVVPYATTPLSIHYRDLGEGDPVVLIQGLGLSSRFWFDIPERVASLGFRVLAPDNRGTGESALPKRPFGMASFAADIARVLDAAGVESAFVAGVSMGGMIAQNFALLHPHRVRGMVLMATTPGMPAGRIPPLGTLGKLVTMPLRRGPDASRALATLLLAPEALPRARELLADWPAAAAADGPRPKTFAAHLGAIATHRAAKRLHTLRCPVHVMTGESDVLVPPQNSEILARLIPGATLERLAGTGHAITAGDRDVVGRALERVRARARPV